MYKIETRQGVFLITVSGFIKKEEADAFMRDYNAKVKLANPPQTNLILDGRNLATSSQDMLPILEGCISMYIKDNFKKIYLVKIESALAMSQLKKLSENFMNKVVLVDSVEEAMGKLTF